MAASSHTQTFDQTQLPPPGPALPPLTGRLHFEAVPGRISVRRVLEATAEHFGATVEALTSDSRKYSIVRQRQVAMYVATQVTGRSLPFIADKMGGFNHTTVLHGKRAVQARIDAGDASAIAVVNAIVAKLAGGANV